MKGLSGKVAVMLMVISLVIGLGFGSAHAQQEVTLNGNDLPPGLLEVINREFNNSQNPELRQLQFRDLNLTSNEALKLFLASDPDKRILRSVGDALKNEQQVRFQGTVGGNPFATRVEREDDGTLRLRMEGIYISGMSPEQLGSYLNNGFDRVRIQGLGDQRFEIRRRDDGTVRAEYRGMDVSGMTPGELTLLAKDKGLDRVRIRGVDKDGNRVRIEYRQDKGIVKWEGVERGATELSRELNNDHGRDRGPDQENKFRDRVERSGRSGRDRIERSVRERVERPVRDRRERHGGSGRH